MEKRTAVIACQMLEHEVRASMERTGLQCPVAWVEREYHDYPERLRARLQEEIDRTRDADTVLLAFSQCGNGTVGLEARHGQLIIPRFADCIHMFRSDAPGNPGDVDIRTLYLSPGFLERREGLFREYDRCAARYGPEKARRVCRMMVQHYRTASMMDTGAVPPEPFLPAAEELAELLGLECGRCTGTIRVFDKLFSGQWDEEFVCVPKGERVGEGAFRVPLRETAAVR